MFILLTGVLAEMANAAGKDQTRVRKASRNGVVTRCHANNGTAYDLDGGASGYGCVAAIGSIHCDGVGNCEANRGEYIVRDKRVTFRLLRPRLR